MGLLKGSLYYYIESKEALLFALVLRAYDNVMNSLASDEELLRGDAIERLCRFIELFIGNLCDNITEAEVRLVNKRSIDCLILIGARSVPGPRSWSHS